MESGSMYGRTGLLMSKQKQAGRQAGRQAGTQSVLLRGRRGGFRLLCECEARGLRIRMKGERCLHFMNEPTRALFSSSFPVPWLPSLLLVFLPFGAYLGIWGVLTGLEICAWNRPDKVDVM
jgi:hypothetical protein